MSPLRLQVEELERRELMAAPFFAAAEPSGSVAVKLYPLANVTVGTPELVTFGLPLTRGSVTPAQLANVRVLVGGVEVPAHVELLTPWRHISDAGIDGQSVRVARIQINHIFASLSGFETITVQWGGPARALNIPGLVDPRTAWHTVTSGSFVAGDNVEEPDVLAVLPKEHLVKGLLDSQTTPVPNAMAETRDNPAVTDVQVFPGYEEYDYASKNFFYTIINQNGSPPATTQPYDSAKEPWLYDRSSAMYELYLRTGFMTALREAVRSTDFYLDRINTDGYFSFADGDEKYAYNECLAYSYWLVGDNVARSKIETVVNAHSGTTLRWNAGLGFWTERNTGFKLLANVIAYEVTGNATYKTNVQTYVGDLAWHQDGAGGAIPAAGRIDGGLYHTGAQHDASESSSPFTSSPWMSVLIVDPMVRVYGVWDTTQVATFLRRMGTYFKAASKTDSNGDYGGTMRYPDYLMNRDGTSDRRTGLNMVEHAIEVAAGAAWATYFAEVLGSPDATLRQLADELYDTYDAGVNYWTRANPPTGTGFNVSPERKYNWMYKTSPSFAWALSNPGTPLPTVTLGLTGGTMAESGGTATVTATLSAPSTSAVTVTLLFGGSASHPADYSRTPLSATSIVIPAFSTTGTITLTAQDDSFDEPNETILIAIDSVLGGTESGQQEVIATIIDNDPSIRFLRGASPQSSRPLPRSSRPGASEPLLLSAAGGSDANDGLAEAWPPTTVSTASLTSSGLLPRSRLTPELIAAPVTPPLPSPTVRGRSQRAQTVDAIFASDWHIE